MNKHVSLSLLGATALAASVAAITPAMAQTPTQQAPHKSMTQTPTHQGERTQAQRPLTASTYVTYAQAGDLFEYEAGKIAMERAQKEPVRLFAQKMVDQHSMEMSKLQAAARQAGVTPTSPALTRRQQAKLDELRSVSTSAFDRTYVEAQREAHERALRLHDAYARNGEQPVLRTASNESVPVIRQHLTEARHLSTQLGATPTTGS